MSMIDETILNDFLKESKGLVKEGLGILEEIEGTPAQYPRLFEYANRIDRIMGAAKNIALMAGPGHALNVVGDASALCKAVGEMGSRVGGQPQLYSVTVSFLLDVTELIDEWLDRLDEDAADLRRDLKGAFVERLRWISDLYKKMPNSGQKDARASEKLNQDAIDEIMKKLGMD